MRPQTGARTPSCSQQYPDPPRLPVPANAKAPTMNRSGYCGYHGMCGSVHLLVGPTIEPRCDMRKRTSAPKPAPLPRLTPPDQRGEIGGLYSAKLLFEFWIQVNGRPGVRRICEERLILLEAASA